jgi:hypothetical protein
MRKGRIWNCTTFLPLYCTIIQSDPDNPKTRWHPPPTPPKIIPAQLSTPQKYFCRTSHCAKKFSGAPLIASEKNPARTRSGRKNYWNPPPKTTISVEAIFREGGQTVPEIFLPHLPSRQKIICRILDRPENIFGSYRIAPEK